VLTLIIAAVIIVRKFPKLANLNTQDLPQEKFLRKKREIIFRRLEKQGLYIKKKLSKLLRPFKEYWDKSQGRFRIYVYKIQRLWQHEQAAKKEIEQTGHLENKEEKLAQVLAKAEEKIKANELDAAESLFISAISIDHKSAVAYRGLGDVYLAKKELEEARQTYLFLLRLEPDDDCVAVKLAEIAESQGNLEEAIEHYQKAVLINDSFAPRFYHLAELLLKIEQPKAAIEAAKQAVELESQNPKYLDLMTEIAIICGDKELAQKSYDQLRLVNPDNQKLNSFRERIQVLK
jgi:tetratricopeptide (TPR) repeat protein